MTFSLPCLLMQVDTSILKSHYPVCFALPGAQHGGGRIMESQALQDSAVRLPFQ